MGFRRNEKGALLRISGGPDRWLDPTLEDYDIETMVATNRIVLDPAIHHGKPVIRGTRVPVTTVVGSLAGGMTFEEIQREYDLSVDDIRAALRFVAELAEQKSFHPLPVA
ncbi:MAG TPA: DUF433 domain-containing protein [Steroidobacteraceae bacterium]